MPADPQGDRQGDRRSAKVRDTDAVLVDEAPSSRRKASRAVSIRAVSSRAGASEPRTKAGVSSTTDIHEVGRKGA